MSIESTAPPAAAVEESLSTSLDLSYGALTDDERAKLSKVLFPDTHTDTIEVMGRERTLRPTSVKVSRQLNELLSPMMKKVQDAQQSEEEVSLDVETLDSLKAVAKCLAAFYGETWDDIVKATDDEDISQVDLESIAYVQQALNGANDFLLQPLRAIVRMLQAREIATVKVESYLSMSISLPS